ncbi:MAG: iron ABC transporter permease, partial [Colwellia sp.]|nr:iron ABC transporter permease [Colwellia sp.]
MLLSALTSSSDLYIHLWQSVLPSYIENTLLLGIYVVLLSVFFGVISAGLITHTNVAAKKLLRWLLILPLAMPAYVVAYLYTDLFDYAGPVQRALREVFNWQSPQDYWFFDIRSLFGAAVVISLVLFPYVYLLTRTAFEQQNQNLLRAGRLLGLSPSQNFINVILPLARPAIAISASLVLMETLADFATVQYFAVNTLTTAIYDTWLGYGDMPSANALATILMLFIFLVVFFEQKARAAQSQQKHMTNTGHTLVTLSFVQQFLASGFCWLLAIAGFLLPFSLLIIMVVEYSSSEQFFNLLDSAFNSIELAIYAATMTVFIALIIAMFQRLSRDTYKNLPLQISSFGYAIPGTVLAMAMLATFAPLDYMINDIAIYLQLTEPGLVFSGTIFAIVAALVVRFSAIANGAISSGLKQIPSALDLAPASLSVGLKTSLTQVHLPLLKSSILGAWLLVFVEAMKELPAVLVLRPFNYETLSTQVYQLISDEML